MVEHSGEGTAGAGPGQGERVAKALARAGVASRRDVERLIGEGRVRLNGRVLDSPAVNVAPGDVLMVDGAVVGEREPTRLWRHHKPVGLITAHKDPGGRPTVFEHLPPGLPRVISVGRLDLSSEGLLLLTNDGALARALELPSTGWVRKYRARAHGRIDQAALDRLKEGITVEGVLYGPIEARLDKAAGATGSNLWITVSLAEGRNREVRRVLEALGLKVNRLIRLAYGPFQLGTLEVGRVEEVGPRVLREQLAPLLPGARFAERAGPPLARSASPSDRAPRREGAAAAPPPEAAPPKKVYKAGWAKPKPKPRPHPAPAFRKKPDPRADAEPAPRSGARPHAPRQSGGPGRPR